MNTASRLEALTKEQGVNVLVSGETVRLLGGSEGLLQVGEVSVRGRNQQLVVWTLESAEASAGHPATSP